MVGGSILVASVVGWALPGCTAPHRDPSPSDYVFFTGDPDLKPVAAPAGVFLYANPRKPLQLQDRIIVDLAQISIQPKSPYWLSPAKSQELAAFLRSEVIAGLSEKYKLVDAPAPGVMRVSLGLADIRRREQPGSPASPDGKPEYQLMLVVLVTDPTTGERVALLRDINRGDEFAAVVKSDEAAARKLLGDWARLLCVRLEEARQGVRQQSAAQP